MSFLEFRFGAFLFGGRMPEVEHFLQRLHAAAELWLGQWPHPASADHFDATPIDQLPTIGRDLDHAPVWPAEIQHDSFLITANAPPGHVLGAVHGLRFEATARFLEHLIGEALWDHSTVDRGRKGGTIAAESQVAKRPALDGQMLDVGVNLDRAVGVAILIVPEFSVGKYE